jgi:hypothetical protein
VYVIGGRASTAGLDVAPGENAGGTEPEEAEERAAVDT